jgi:pilus assembly protein CpaC
VTPYLVRPVNANEIVLPTDGYRNATMAQRFLTNGIADGTTGQGRPMPTLENPDNAQPGPAAGGGAPRPAMAPQAPAQQSNNNRRGNRGRQDPAAPGFSFRQ